MYKVFINQKVIMLAQGGSKAPSDGNFIRFTYESGKTINEALITLLNRHDIQGIIIENDDVEELWQKFKKQFLVIEAAGGLVKNPQDEILFIHRLGKWDLPKGKVEPGEEIDEAAVREVEEECGISDLEILKPLPVTSHIYQLEGNFVLKNTFWFEMLSREKTKPKAQREEGITSAKWLGQEGIQKALKNTYPSIRELISNYLKSF